MTTFPRAPSDPGAAAHPSARELLRRFHALPEARLALLRQAAEVALACDCALYWVGGGVRDLWLGTSEPDVDLVVDGDLVRYARELAGRFRTGFRSHPEFLTAELLAPGGVRVDLAQARSERYAAPATLPIVAPGTLASDFARRDFTINCLSIALAPDFGERLIDACGGLEDLAHRRLRTLHAASFRDDPTRILRGLEFEARFGFELAPEARTAAEQAIAGGVLTLLSAGRLGDAFRRALRRAAGAPQVLRRMHELALLAAIEPGLGRAAGAAAELDAALPEAVGEQPGTAFRLALLCLALELDAGERQRLARRLALTAAERVLVTGGPERVRAAITALAAESRPSLVHRQLGALADEELAVVAASGGKARSWVRRERSELRALQLRIHGGDLIAAGEPPGPALGRALELTLAARLDGRIGAEDELAFALGAARLAAGEGSA